MYELECRYDTRSSFYGKAQVEIVRNTYEQVENLYSYGTLVASIIYDFKDMSRTYKYYGKYSQTTTRHQKEFFRQSDLTEKEIKELFKKGELRYEYNGNASK